jgi:hypothetical protein
MTCVNAAGASASHTRTTSVYAAPTVDVTLDGQDGPVSRDEPAGFTLAWTSTGAITCTAGDALSGPIGVTGSRPFTQVPAGTYTYSVTCTNPAGATAQDSVVLTVVARQPTVDLRVDGQDGPITREAPAEYTLSWTSQSAGTCTAAGSGGDWTGNQPTGGSIPFSGVGPGTRTYTLTCWNGVRSASDSVTVEVIDPLGGTLVAQYPHLVLFASRVGQPGQSLWVTINGGDPPYSVQVTVRSPSGDESTYDVVEPSWSLSPEAAGDPDFGTTEEGVWTAWADLSDGQGQSVRTNSATWQVRFYPVHGRP